MVATKRCSKCRETKPLSDFHRSKNCKGGHNTRCKVCRHKAQRAYYLANRERILAQHRQYREANPERTRERAKEYNRRWLATEHGQQTRKEQLRRYQQSPEGVQANRASSRRYYHTPKGLLAVRQYLETDHSKELRLNTNQRRRARKAGTTGSHTRAQFVALCEATGFRCLGCGYEFPLEALTEDHIVPLGPDSSDDISNIQPLCRSCNSRKGTQTIDYRMRTSCWRQAKLAWLV